MEIKGNINPIEMVANYISEQGIPISSISLTTRIDESRLTDILYKNKDPKIVEFKSICEATGRDIDYFFKLWKQTFLDNKGG